MFGLAAHMTPAKPRFHAVGGSDTVAALVSQLTAAGAVASATDPDVLLLPYIEYLQNGPAPRGPIERALDKLLKNGGEDEIEVDV